MLFALSVSHGVALTLIEMPDHIHVPPSLSSRAEQLLARARNIPRYLAINSRRRVHSFALRLGLDALERRLAAAERRGEHLTDEGDR